MAKDDKDSADTPPKKSKKKLLILIAGVLLIVASGAGFVIMSGGKSGPTAPTPGTIIPLDAITVNLASGHYLKVKIVLQGTSSAGAELDGNQALDLAISEFTNHAMAEYATQEGRDKAKKDLLTAMAATHEYKGKVMDIYFAEFVMQ